MTATDTSDPRHGKIYKATYTAICENGKPETFPFEFTHDKTRFKTPESHGWSIASVDCIVLGLTLVSVTVEQHAVPPPRLNYWPMPLTGMFVSNHLDSTFTRN